MPAIAIKNEVFEILNRLTPDQQREVRDFAAFLGQDHSTGKRKTYISGKGWFGELADVADKGQSSVEVQHEIKAKWSEID